MLLHIAWQSVLGLGWERREKHRRGPLERRVLSWPPGGKTLLTLLPAAFSGLSGGPHRNMEDFAARDYLRPAPNASQLPIPTPRSNPISGQIGWLSLRVFGTSSAHSSNGESTWGLAVSDLQRAARRLVGRSIWKPNPPSICLQRARGPRVIFSSGSWGSHRLESKDCTKGFPLTGRTLVQASYRASMPSRARPCSSKLWP